MIESVESLIEKHQALVISIANRIHKRLPPFIPFEDVLSCGQVGLAQAARTYQPQPGAKFSTYAYYRITGGIYDGLSRMNWSTRAEYRRYKAMQMANAVVEANAADSSESAEAESNAKWFANTVENLSVVYLFSAGDEENPIENQLAAEDHTPDQQAETNELKDKLHRALASLPDEERKLIQLSYFEGMSLAEAASQLNKSRSWGSRTHARILKSLGSQLLGTSS
ncbi:MAG: sigma-70 family RNA polymerase sigma factor [Planctomycetota bacterium]